MTETIVVRAIEEEAERQRLREFIAAMQGARGLLAFEAHLARARYRTDFTLVVERDQALLGCVLLRHARWRYGAASIDVGVVERLLLSVDDDSLFEALLGAMLQTCSDHEMALIAAVQPPARFMPIGFALYSYRSEVWLPAAREAKSLQRVRYALRPLNDRLDGPGDLEPLYAASYGAAALSEERVRPDWRSWLEAGQVAHILEDRREATVGYAVMEGDLSSGMTISELAVADAGIAHGMAAMLADAAATRSAAGVTLRLPGWHPFVRVALEHGASLTVCVFATDRGEPVPLAGIVDLRTLVSQISAELEQRLARSRYAGWNGSLAFALEGGTTAIEFQQGHASIPDEATHADVRIQVASLGALTQLVLGYRSAADLCATAGLDCAPTSFGLLDAMFPPL